MFLGFEFIRMGDYLIFGILIILIFLSTKQIMAALVCTLVFVAIVMLVLKRRKAKAENTICTLYEKKAVLKTKDKEKVIEYKDIKDLGYYQTFSQKIFNVGDIRIYPDTGILITSAINMTNVRNVKEEYEKVKEIIQKQIVENG